MSLLLKNRETLTQLFSTFNLQEVLQVNQNLQSSWHLMTLPPAQLMAAMEQKQVSIEQFLGKKCLPLIRFYLADKSDQKAVFLSQPQLAKLFMSLPAVEAMVFKTQIERAQRVVQQTNQALATVLGEVSLVDDKKDAIVQFTHYQSHKKQALAKLAEAHKPYLDCFYYLQAGELGVVAEGQVLDKGMLLYSELSPLQQLQAQQHFKQKEISSQAEPVSQQSASA